MEQVEHNNNTTTFEQKQKREKRISRVFIDVRGVRLGDYHLPPLGKMQKKITNNFLVSKPTKPPLLLSIPYFSTKEKNQVDWIFIVENKHRRNQMRMM